MQNAIRWQASDHAFDRSEVHPPLSRTASSNLYAEAKFVSEVNRIQYDSDDFQLDDTFSTMNLSLEKYIVDDLINMPMEC